jgi:hypothetical protein
MDSNIYLWVMSWWGPWTRTDNTTKIILDYMKNQTSTTTFPINNFRTSFFYETWERIPQISTTGLYDTKNVKADIEYLATNYFNRTNRLKINNSPVVFVYLTRSLFKKNSTNSVYKNLLEEVVALMRQGASNKGYSLYIVGDHAFTDPPTSTSFIPFTILNAVTNYDVFGAMNSPYLYANDTTVEAYKVKQQGWKTTANAQGCDFIPSVTPGFNKQGNDLNFTYGPMSRRLNSAAGSEGSLLRALLTNAVQLVDPNANRIVMINSFNEWHEDTQMEPVRPLGASTTLPNSLTKGLKYEAYGKLYLDIVKNITK